ncbi:hypothetical protein Taro_049614 [Colocasia esculenta]|uniref:Aminotransferase-like plant mobile domain-containing protein n=1 Tax=Colocasia esculenta TaxID=4460 RepID=A0A843XBF7_COLES|nr:hypothetical protein [Colocasia esculenta]
MLLTTKGDGIHCRFLEILEDLERVGQYAWGAAFLAHTFADLSSGTKRETTVGDFAPFPQVWSYYYIPLGRVTEVHAGALPLARRWLPAMTLATFSLQLDSLCRGIQDFSALLVVWQPYVGMGDDGQPWVESGRPRFGHDLWVHYLNEIEPLHLRLAARTLGLHQEWNDETEPRGIGRRTRGKVKWVDWRLLFPDQYDDWQRGSQLVESDAPNSLTYLQRFQEEYGGRDFMRPTRDARDDLIDTLRAQLAGTEVQLAQAREALRAAQTTVEHTNVGGASTSQGVPDPEMTSLREQLATALARAEEEERDLTTWSDKLQSALSWETCTSAVMNELSQQLAELRTQVSQQDSDLPRTRPLGPGAGALTQQVVDARTSLGISKRLLREVEDRYQRGHERAMREGRASAYSGSYLVSSSQYQRNVQEERAA